MKSVHSLTVLFLPAILALGALGRTDGPDADAPAAASCCAAGSTAGEHAVPAGKPSLEAVKRLAGAWYAADEDGNPTGDRLTEYRVTAGGNAVIETNFPGQEHEMISIYSMDGDDLVLTHYCVLGNHPRMRASVDAESGELVFACVGGTNFDDCTRVHHMHEGRVTPVDGDHYRARWTPMQDGKDGDPVVLDLVRAR